MEETLKITNVLSDPTRFKMYNYILKNNKIVTVSEMAEKFDIHPNVARLHLSKLEEIDALISDYERTGKGGRPRRLYKLSDNVIELNFPHRDYKLLASMAIETFAGLGEIGEQALFATGKKYGQRMLENELAIEDKMDLTIEEKIKLLERAGTMLGMYPKFSYNPKQHTITWKVMNCPFKEVVEQNQELVCNVHYAFLKGMFEVLFEEIPLLEAENMFKGCEHCLYVAKLEPVS